MKVTAKRLGYYIGITNHERLLGSNQRVIVERTTLIRSKSILNPTALPMLTAVFKFLYRGNSILSSQILESKFNKYFYYITTTLRDRIFFKSVGCERATAPNIPSYRGPKVRADNPDSIPFEGLMWACFQVMLATMSKCHLNPARTKT